MLGRQSGDQASLFYEFRLDDRVPKNHLLRRINVFVTAGLADVHEQLDPYYSEIGRTPAHPDNIIFDINPNPDGTGGTGQAPNGTGGVGQSASGFSHPKCLNNPNPSTLPAVH